MWASMSLAGACAASVMLVRPAATTPIRMRLTSMLSSSLLLRLAAHYRRTHCIMRTLVWIRRNGVSGGTARFRRVRMRAVVGAALCLVVAVVGLAAQVRTGALTIYYIDTEGGQSTLFVGPTGESLLVDTGNPGARDLGRIVETLRGAGLSKLDHLWITHYHSDHIG